jgi:hypothetical protein
MVDDKAKVIVKDALHYQDKVVGMFFELRPGLNEAVKKIQGVKYSRTMRGWYAPWRFGIVDEIRQAFAGAAIVIEEEGLAKTEHLASPTLLKIPEEYMNLLIRKRYSDATVRNYCSQFEMFFRFFNKSPEQIDEG